MKAVSNLTQEFKAEAVAWLNEVSKYPLINEYALFEEILSAQGDGKGSYELGSYCTKSGRPELLDIYNETDFIWEEIED